jgi:predicted Zn-dependent peptidase
MIETSKKILKNGLTGVHHFDETSPFVVVNTLYKIGAKDEDPERTGFAHLFEHLMFEGSKNSDTYDEPLQEAGGENNAFTNNDYTNYYCQVPKNNLDVALFLEADRMCNLKINQRALNEQKKVVIEEFKEHYINQPYGNVWHILREMIYEKHPYMWPTIGKTTDHVANATLEDVKSFYTKYYQPSNAILVVGGNLDKEFVFERVEHFFGEINFSVSAPKNLISEPIQSIPKEKTVFADVSLDAIYIAFKAPDRFDPNFFVSDLVSDILSGSQSSRLYQKLVKEKKLFVSIDAYISASNEVGLFCVEGKIAPGIDPKIAESAIWEELELLKNEAVSFNELQKIKNKTLSHLNFSDTSLMSKVINIAYFELLGDANLINKEEENYLAVSAEAILAFSNHTFQKDKSNTLHYLKKENDIK